jgi:isoleucyl-tRNA synthetase
MPKVTNFNQQPNFPELEQEVLQFWQADNTFAKSIESRPEDKAYIFYDGPPFATGLPHYGHLLASTTKDVVPRYWTMKGYRVDRIWGWDCHGLPIENMIEKKLNIQGGKKGIEALGIATFNDACRQEVLLLDKEWEKIIARLGRWVDFEHSYKTMDKTFMESVWWGFKALYDKGLVYEGRKVILYCPRCSTPLSNFEVAMDNSYQEVTEPSTTYKYQVKGEDSTFLLAWSTTPWNKIVTPALAVNPNLTYVKVKQGGEYYYLAESTLGMLRDEPYEVVESLTGSELEKVEFEPHFNFFPETRVDERVGVVVADEFVTAEEGTGIVTLAVYGEDDYRVMKAHHIQMVEHVDEEGRLKSEVTPWAGSGILEVNPLVDEDLQQRGLIYKTEAHTHSVATCYRCGTRLYYAPLPAWFIDVASLRGDLISQNEHINWYPTHLKHGRFLKGLENAPDWNISRSRYWGTPMPIWQADTTELSGNQKNIRIIGSLAELQEWAVDPSKVEGLTDIHPEFLQDIEVWIDDERTIKGQRIREVFDCWVESGSMPFAVQHYPFANQQKFESNYPAQFVSEYIAQTRAWFYTMHVLSVGLFGKPPFENVLTTGTILAEDGTKMSKSKKNYPDPMVLIDKYGVDSLRLYLMSSPVMKGENLNFSEKEVADIRRRVFVIWWNVLSFFHTFADTSVNVTQAPEQVEHVLDQWLMASLAELVDQTTKDMDNYDVVRSSRRLMEFVDTLSTWYLRLSRERIKAQNNRQVSQVFGYALSTLAKLFAPFAPFFSEMVYHTLIDDKGSVHLSAWPETHQYQQFENKTLLQEMNQVRQIVEAGHAQRKDQALKVRQPLAKITVSLEQKLTHAEVLAELIKGELNVKAVDWNQQAELSVQLDTVLTPELKAEGEAREVMRTIQNLRKEAGLKAGDAAKVQLPTWPAEWQAEIEKKTSVTLTKGDVATIVS